jgi:ribosomal protein S27AE
MIMPTSPVGHAKRRHPLCPSCGYDLVATIHEGKWICPECGEEFNLDDVRREVWPGNWTFPVGLRKLLISLLVRSVVAAIVWSSGTWFTFWFTRLFPAGTFRSRAMLIIYLLGAGFGAVVGLIESRRLTDRAGFAGWLVTSLAVAACAIVIIGATRLVEMYTSPIPVNVRFYFCGFGIVLAGALVVWYTVAE